MYIHHTAISGRQGPGATESVQRGRQKERLPVRKLSSLVKTLASLCPGLPVFLPEMMSWPCPVLILPSGLSQHPSALLQLVQTLPKADALAG